MPRFQLWFQMGIYWSISMVLVMLFSLFVPSLGHLQEFQLGDGPLWDLDLLSPWVMALSLVLLTFLGQLEADLGLSTERGSRFVKRMLPVYMILWLERVMDIYRSTQNPGILVPYFLGVLWLGLFALVLWDHPGTAQSPMSIDAEPWGAGFFWVMVHYSFAVQIALNGYGAWGMAQAPVFLGLSLAYFRDLARTNDWVRVRSSWFHWIYGLSWAVWGGSVFWKAWGP